MLRIRLQRAGRRNRAFYRLALTEHTNPANSGALAFLGSYDPLAATNGFNFDAEAIAQWIKKGAQPSSTVARLLKGAGVDGMEPFIEEMKSRKKKNAPDEPTPAPVSESAPAEAPSDEAAPAESPESAAA